MEHAKGVQPHNIEQFSPSAWSHSCGTPWRCAKALASHRCSPGSIPGLVCGKALSSPCGCPVVFLRVFFHPQRGSKISSYKPVRVGRVLDLHSGDVKHTFIIIIILLLLFRMIWVVYQTNMVLSVNYMFH